MNDGYCDNCKKEAHDQCNEMNRSAKNDPNYLAYVVGPIPLN